MRLRSSLSKVHIPLEQLAARWAKNCKEIIIRRCPICEQDSNIGQGRRRKQAHDEYRDWIGIRRGLCTNCGTTFTFLPLFFSSLYALQSAGALPGTAAAHSGALFMGDGRTEAEGSGSRSRRFYGSALVEGSGRFSAGILVSPLDRGSSNPLAEARPVR